MRAASAALADAEVGSVELHVALEVCGIPCNVERHRHDHRTGDAANS